METRLGFFSGMLLGMLSPLLLFGGEIHGGKNTITTEAFYGGIIAGIVFDIALVVGLIFLFK